MSNKVINMNSDDEWSSPEIDDGPRYVPGMDAYTRVGPGGFLGGDVRPIDRATQDPLERFQRYVDAISRNLSNWQGVNISEQMIDDMVQTARKLDDVKYKNPTAYVLGYLGSNAGKKIDKKSIDHVLTKVLPHVQENFVLPPDVIRYSKLWLTL